MRHLFICCVYPVFCYFILFVFGFSFIFFEVARAKFVVPLRDNSPQGLRAGITQLPSWAGNEIPHELAPVPVPVPVQTLAQKYTTKREWKCEWNVSLCPCPVMVYTQCIYIVYCRTARPFVWEGTTKAKQNGVQTVATFPDPSKKDSDSAPDPDPDRDPDRNPATDPKNLCLTQSFSLRTVIA